MVLLEDEVQVPQLRSLQPSVAFVVAVPEEARLRSLPPMSSAHSR